MEVGLEVGKRLGMREWKMKTGDLDGHNLGNGIGNSEQDRAKKRYLSTVEVIPGNSCWEGKEKRDQEKHPAVFVLAAW